MKKINIFILVLLTSVLAINSCNKELKNDIKNLENRVSKLEVACEKLNKNILSLKDIISTLEKHDYITSVTPLMENGKEIGFILNFKSSGEIRIYHGQDGVDGNDGHTPAISVKKDDKGFFYWTLDGEWIIDENSNKIKVNGIDGKDGLTPKMKIEEGYWFVSYDNGVKWEKLGKATGDKGKDGTEIFKNIKKENDSVVLTLNDDTVIRIPLITNDNTVRAESIIYLPQFSDGIAEFIPTKDTDKGRLKLTFRVLPTAYISQLDMNWDKIMKVESFYTNPNRTKSTSFIDLPILSYSSDKTNGTITIVLSGRNLDNEFYSRKKDVMGYLVISEGSQTLVSDKILIRCKESNMPIKIEGGYRFKVAGIEFDMVNVEAGSFIMGSDKPQDRPDYLLNPKHNVTLTKKFLIGKTEVTQELWKAVLGSLPKQEYENPKHPVGTISWLDIMEKFIPELNKLTGQNFTLPTEAQWEFAARGGNQSLGYKYSGSDNLDEVAWYETNSNNMSHPVASKKPNELGIFDMTGNQMEWCYDWGAALDNSDQTDPKGPANSYSRVLRGGWYGNDPSFCQTFFRAAGNPSTAYLESTCRLTLNELIL